MCCTVLLKPNIKHINTFKSGYNEISPHGGICFSIENNGCAVLVFEEMWDNDVCTPQSAPNNHLYCINRLFNHLCGFIDVATQIKLASLKSTLFVKRSLDTFSESKTMWLIPSSLLGVIPRFFAKFDVQLMTLILMDSHAHLQEHTKGSRLSVEA